MIWEEVEEGKEEFSPRFSGTGGGLDEEIVTKDSSVKKRTHSLRIKTDCDDMIVENESSEPSKPFLELGEGEFKGYQEGSSGEKLLPKRRLTDINALTNRRDNYWR